MRRHISVMLAAALCCPCMLPERAALVVRAEALGGKCGENAYWKYDSGTLTVYGEGAVDGYLLYASNQDGWLEDRTDIDWQALYQEIRTVVVQGDITELGSYSFLGFENLTELRITAPITGISSTICRACPNLETIILPDALQTIESAAFNDAVNLTTLVLPEHIVQIGANAFSASKKLCTEVGGMRILNDTYLLSYTGSAAEVTVPDGILAISERAFSGNNTLRTVHLPDSLLHIGNGAFMSCENLADINLPDTVQYLGYTAFRQCKRLTDITLPDALPEIPNYLFEECSSLRSVKIPDSVTKIGSWAFYNCENLTDLNIPSHVTSIDYRAFSECKKLNPVTIPDTLVYVGEHAFENCTSLLEYYRREDGFALIDDKLLTELPPRCYTIRIPEGTTVIASGLCDSAETVYRVICPESLRVINERAFYRCKNLMAAELNDGLEIIGSQAFNDCPALTELTIPASVTEIGWHYEETMQNLRCIYGTPDTEAERFAKECGIPFCDAANPPQYRDMTLDYTADGWSFGNSSEAFGSRYYLTEDALAAVQALIGGYSDFYENAWSGSCFGLSAGVILAKNGLLPPASLQAGAQSLGEVAPAPQVQSLINYYHAVQYSDYYRAAASEFRNDALSLRYFRIWQAAKNVSRGGSPFLLEISLGGSGMHAVVGYGEEAGEWVFAGKVYDRRVLVWDPNFPAALHEESCLYLNSETLLCCIPYYDIYCDPETPTENSGGIANLCDDAALLNRMPYPAADVPQPGDMDGDLALTAADAVLLARVLAEDETLADIDFACADVDADGMLTLLDLHALLKVIA